MATVKGSKQQKLVVVPYRPWRNFLLSSFYVLSTVAIGVGAYLYGHDRGIIENGNALAERDALREAVALSNGENVELKQLILNFEQSGTVDTHALASVQQTIVGLREKISQLEEDVLFYKQIMSPGNAETGLVIGQLDLVATDSPGTIHYKLELKQQGNNENLISGYANINVLGMQGNEEISLRLSDLSQTEQSPDIRLQFRYFQNIEGELQLPASFEPTKVQIIAIASGANAKTVQKSFGWLVEN